MEKMDLGSIGMWAIGILIGVISALVGRYWKHQEGDNGRYDAGIKALSDKHEEIYKSLTESTHKLSLAVERLTLIVGHTEEQSSGRYLSLNSRIDDLKGNVLKNELYNHWSTNKFNIIRGTLETLTGKSLSGNWEAP